MRGLGDDVGDCFFVLGILGRARPIDGKIAGCFRIKLRLALHRFFQIDHRRQGLVIDRDQIGAIERLRGAFRHHHRHRHADMHHLVAGNRRPRRQNHLGAAAARDRRMTRNVIGIGLVHVGGGNNAKHALRFQGGAHIDRLDARMCMRRAHEGGVGLVRQARVVGKAAIAAYQSIVLDARFVFAAGGGGHGHEGLPACGVNRCFFYNLSCPCQQGLA